MPSLRLRLLNRILRLTVKRRMSHAELTPGEIAKTRARMDKMGRAGGERKSKRVEFSNSELGGVPVCWTKPKLSKSASDAAQTDVRPVILHLHGGAYIVGSSDAYRPLSANLALMVDAKVAVLDYRLAPETPYPAAPDDALSAYRALLQQGVPAQRIVISGDSAGGNLALVTLLRIKEARLPVPAAGVLLSPWADLTGSGESITTNVDEDAMLPAKRIAEAAYVYAGETDLRNWRISPLFGDYAGLPPLCIHVGSGEILRDDARRVAACAQEAGVAVNFKEWHKAPHVFPVFADLLPEGKAALTEIAQWINRQLPDRAAMDTAAGKGAGTEQKDQETSAEPSADNQGVRV